MSDHSPHPSEPCLFQESKQHTVPGAKRLWDSVVQVEALQSAKKACVLSHVCSTPGPSGDVLLTSSGSACFEKSFNFQAEAGQGDLAASLSVSNYNDVNISLDTSSCFDDSELDDALLELSDSEKGNSPFHYTEEEIQKILADDCLEAEQHLNRESSLSQNGNEESKRAESSSCTEAPAGSEDANVASEVTEKPKEPLPKEHSSVSSGSYPGGLDGNHLQPAQDTPKQLNLDLGLQELLRSLSPFNVDCSDESPRDSYAAEIERETVEAMIDDCLECIVTTSSCVLEESSEGVMPKGQKNLDLNPGRSLPPSDLTSGQSTGNESSAPELPSDSRNQELPTATKSCFPRKSASLEDGEGQSAEAEQSPGSLKSGDTAGNRIEQEETTSEKKPGKVIPNPQEEEERPKHQPCSSEVEPEPKKHLYPESACPCEDNYSSYIRNLPRSARNLPKGTATHSG